MVRSVWQDPAARPVLPSLLVFAAPFTRRFASALLLCLPTLLAYGCGGPQAKGGAESATSAEIECPSPIGTISRESCPDIADDFGALDVSGARKLVGTAKSAEVRIDAINAAGALAASLKERRVALCEQYNACKITPLDHAIEDKRLAELMQALIEAWDARNLLAPDGAIKLREKVSAISDKLERGSGAEGGADSAGGKSKAARIAADALSKIEGAGLSFSTASGAVTITSTGEGEHDALRGGVDKLRLVGGGRYLVHVEGTYAPAQAPLIKPGDDLTVRLKYRGAKAGDVFLALRSFEDPEASESTSTFKANAGATMSEQATLTAAPGGSGFFLGIGGHGVGALELDEIEISTRGSVVASANAEAPSEPNVKTSCTIATTRALAGKASFRCEAESDADRLTIGMPKGHLYLAIRTSGTDKAVVRTQSLEGGRSVDASVKEDAELIIGLSGPGSASIRSVAVEKLP